MPSGQIAQAQITDANPDEFFDFIPQLVKHPADLTIDSLAQDNPHPRHPDCLHLFHSGPLAGEHEACQ